MLYRLKNKLKDKKNIRLIKKSYLFDSEFYTTNNPNVFGNPCTHYYYHGWKLGYDPSIDFCGNKYLDSYLDVKDMNINPLFHYLKFGRKEGRIITKSSGVMNISSFYESMYSKAYSYHLYYYGDKKRINLFIDKSDDSILSLVSIIYSYAKQSNYTLRIICNFIHELNVNDDVELINYNSSNYIEVSIDDKYITTSWEATFALLNTNPFFSNIFYFITENSDSYNISNICHNKRVIPLVKDIKNIPILKKYNIKFEWNNKKLNITNDNYLYCNFGDYIIEGVHYLNNLFLNNVLDMDNWKVYFVSDKKFIFHLDCGLCVRSCEKIQDNASLIIDKSFVHNDCSCIKYSVKKGKLSCEFLDINSKDFKKQLDKSNYRRKEDDNSLERIIKKMRGD